MAAKKPAQPFQVGDRVRILHTDNWIARIVEFRGPLGPKGMLVYRVRVPGKPKPTYIELCEDQIVPIPATPKVESASLPITDHSNPRPTKAKTKAKQTQL